MAKKAVVILVHLVAQRKSSAVRGEASSACYGMNQRPRELQKPVVILWMMVVHSDRIATTKAGFDDDVQEAGQQAWKESIK